MDMCNEWGFTTQCENKIAVFFDTDIRNIYRRIAKLKKLEVVKKIEYNGRIGFMINPIYCYQGSLRLKRFRVKLWQTEKLYSKSHSQTFYGPPIHSAQEFKNNKINRARNGRFAWIRGVNK